MNNLKEGDFVNGRLVKKVTDKFVFFENEKISKKKLEGCKILRQYNIKKEVDYTNEQEVKDYFNSFQQYSFDVRGNTPDTLQLQVKDNLISMNGEYYMYYPYSGHSKTLEDGCYNVRLYKTLDYCEPFILYNVFIKTSKVLTDAKDLKNNCNEIRLRDYDNYLTISYTASYRGGFNINSFYFDVERFFKEFYINHRWDSGISIILTDEQIYEITSKFYDKVWKLIDNALNNEDYYLDADESYGDFSFRYLQLDSDVCKEIFQAINDSLKQ